MEKNKKILLFYLKTGGGHLAPARSIADYLERKYPDKITPVLINGFTETNNLLRYLVEDGYRILQAEAKWYYEMLYAMNKVPLMAKINCRIITMYTKDYIKKMILAEKPDKLVILHFFMIEPVYEAVQELKLDIPIFTIVTDPYTAHPMWFLRKKQHFIVFSEKLKSVVKPKLPQSKINVFPFVLDEKFTNEMSSELVPEIKEKLGFPSDKKVILIMGGGDGIPHGRRILKEILEEKIDAVTAVVCGKNKKLFKDVEALKIKFPDSLIFNYGYIDFVYELLNVSDVVITKCGASTMMEILMQKKVPVVNDFIWEQEKGNMEFIRDHKLGIYEPDAKKIPAVLKKLLYDEKFYNFYRDNIIKEGLENGTGKVAEYLVNELTD
jgi:UDP-N-acetylglucosamine:LPS N-acetylglucosamine transferase